MCPEEICDCMVLHKCKELHQLAINHKFDELKSNHKQCGFDDKNIPKYCCPISVWKKSYNLLKNTWDDKNSISRLCQILLWGNWI